MQNPILGAAGLVFPANFDGTPDDDAEANWESPFGPGDHFKDAEIIAWFRERAQTDPKGYAFRLDGAADGAGSVGLAGVRRPRAIPKRD
jgi:hypothetical protein